jgi:aminoglycoside 6'-N-acetyltransferase I
VDVRPAAGADRAEWIRLRRALWPEADSAELASEIDAILASDRLAAFVAARPGGRLAGLVEASLRDVAEGCATSPVGYIEGWYVDPDARRVGVGRRLVAAAEAWALARGCREMASDSVLSNLDGQAAHRALGYAEVERAVHFRKDLQAD